MSTMFYIITTIAVVMVVFTIVLMFSSTLRGKMLSKQVKSMKYMMDESKDDLESISTDMANATKGGIETTTRAIKKGLTEEEDIYCKHCGSKIDHDSTFCKKCGKKQ